MPECRIIEDAEDLAAPEAEWWRLRRCAAPVPFLSPAGWLPRWRVFEPGALRIGVSDGGRPVALYSPGSPELLATATLEVVSAPSDGGLLGLDRTVRDIGRGIGRPEAALSPRVAAVIGLDTSPVMIAAARRQ